MGTHRSALSLQLGRVVADLDTPFSFKWVNLLLFAQSGVSEVLGEFTAFFYPCHSHLDNNSRTINPPVETELLPRPHHSSLLL